MKSFRRARGAALLSILMTTALLMAGITLTLKLGPHYIDWRTMQSVFEGLRRQPINDMDKSEIREAIRKAFRVNNLRDFNLSEVITIEDDKEKTTLTIAYERREHIFFNVDVVLSFAETFQYP